MTSLCAGGMERIDGGSPAFGNREDFFQYFQNTWLDGNFPIRMHRRLQARAYPGIARVISNHAYSYHEDRTRKHVHAPRSPI